MRSNRTVLLLTFTFVLAVSGTAFGQCVSGECGNGTGKYIYPNGDVYEGTFVNNKREGTGTMVFKSTSSYTGQWKDNTMHGSGVYKFVSGDRFEGEYINGVRHGRGIYMFASGSYYSGEYRNGKRNGQGKFFNKAKNTIQEGIWTDDLFTPAQSVAPVLSQAELLKRQIAYMDDIEARITKNKQLLSAFDEDAPPAQRRQNLLSRKTELTAIGAIATKALSEFGDQATATSKAYFTAKAKESKDGLVYVGNALDMMMDDNEPATGNGFLDRTSSSTGSTAPSAASANPENLGRDLYEAVEANDTERAIQLINSGSNVHYRTWAGPVKKTDFIGENTLSVAILNKNLPLAKALLNAGADPNSLKDGYEDTAFYSAIEADLPEMVELLLKYKADVKTRNQSGWTPLHSAANRKNGDRVVKMLLAAGADPNVYNSRGESPLALAQDLPDAAIVSTLTAASNATIRAEPITNNIPTSPLGVNVKYPQPTYNIKPKAANATELARSLWDAVAKQNTSEVVRLISAGAEVNWSLADTPIINKAVEMQNLPIVQLLLEAGADPNAKDGQYGLTALHEAISRNRIEMVKLLLRYKANPNQQSLDGRTALHIAAIWNGNDKISAILIDAGANPNSITSDNRTAKSIALSQNRQQIANLIDKSLGIKTYAAGVAPKAEPKPAVDTAYAAKLERERKVSDAIKEYNRVHPQVEAQGREYARAYEKYVKGGPDFRIFMKGTQLSMIRARDIAFALVRNLQRDYGKFLPQDLKDHINDDLSKFPPLPW